MPEASCARHGKVNCEECYKRVSWHHAENPTSTKRNPPCGCSEECGDLPEEEDHPWAICKGL